MSQADYDSDPYFGLEQQDAIEEPEDRFEYLHDPFDLDWDDDVAEPDLDEPWDD